MGAPPDAASIEADLRRKVSQMQGAELVEAGRVAIAGGEAVKCDYTCAVAPPPGQREASGAATTVYYYSEVVAVRPKGGFKARLLFECPKDRFAKAKAGWAKILKRLKLGA
jgi:hypothetical protein